MKRILPNSFCEANINLIPKHQKYIIKIYRLICLMNIDTKILNKIWKIEIKIYIKSLMFKDQVELTPEILDWCN